MRAPNAEEFLHADSSPLYALLWPIIWTTREFMEDTRWQFSWWYQKAHYDFDRDCDLYAILPVAPFVKLWAFWQKHRWSLERWLVRGGVLELKEGGYYRDARAPQHWGLE